MKVGKIITFTLPSSKKKIAGKILEVREKNILVQTKDGKKVIPKSLFNKKSKFEKKVETKPQAKKMPPKITGEQMRSIKIIEPSKKKKANKTYLVIVDGEKDRKLTLSLLKQFISKKYGKKLTSGQEKKIDFMANVTLKGEKDGFFIIDHMDNIYTNHNQKSISTGDYVGKIDMRKKERRELTEEKKKDLQFLKEKKEKEEEQKEKEHKERFKKMEGLKDLWEGGLKDLNWSAYDRKEIDYYIDNADLDGPAYSSRAPMTSPGEVKAEVVQKGKRPVKNVLRIYYSNLIYSRGNIPGKFKKEDFEFPEEEKKEPQKAKKKGKTKKEKEENLTEQMRKVTRELTEQGLSGEEIVKELGRRFG